MEIKYDFVCFCVRPCLYTRMEQKKKFKVNTKTVKCLLVADAIDVFISNNRKWYGMYKYYNGEISFQCKVKAPMMTTTTTIYIQNSNAIFNKRKNTNGSVAMRRKKKSFPFFIKTFGSLPLVPYLRANQF